jgi:hypothetical protein
MPASPEEFVTAARTALHDADVPAVEALAADVAHYQQRTPAGPVEAEARRLADQIAALRAQGELYRDDAGNLAVRQGGALRDAMADPAAPDPIRRSGPNRDALTTDPTR